jgi:hypothetical protein
MDQLPRGILAIAGDEGHAPVVAVLRVTRRKPLELMSAPKGWAHGLPILAPAAAAGHRLRGQLVGKVAPPLCQYFSRSCRALTRLGPGRFAADTQRQKRGRQRPVAGTPPRGTGRTTDRHRNTPERPARKPSSGPRRASTRRSAGARSGNHQPTTAMSAQAPPSISASSPDVATMKMEPRTPTATSAKARSCSGEGKRRRVRSRVTANLADLNCGF